MDYSSQKNEAENTSETDNLLESEGPEIKNNSTKSNNSQQGGMIMEGWMKIKSEEFKNKNKFPAIEVDGKKYSILSDSQSFRINQSFDDKKKDEVSPKNKLDFYFRLTKNLLYYSINKKDLNVIGSIDIQSVKEITYLLPGDKKDDLCFQVTDSEFSQWNVCTDSNENRNKWICKIKIGLGKIKNDAECENKKSKNSSSNSSNVNIGEQTFQPIIVIPIPSKSCNQGWNYGQKGKDWECGCSEGFEQSPIDIPDKSNVVESPISPLFTFDVIPAKSQITTIDGELKTQEYIKIKYFKNALRILHSNLGKIVTLDGSVYIGEEIVFHTPSEHKINGKAFDMEMQVIFYGRSKGDIAKQVVLSFLFEKKAGVYNKFLDDIDFFSLPNSFNAERDLIHDLYIPKVFYKSNEDSEITMKPFSFYTYQGSLTMPPCSEQTIHYVVADPIPLASVPITLFQEAIRGADKGEEIAENNRETQPLNGRNVFFFDKEKYSFGDLPTTQNKTKKPSGHYEKVKRRVEDIFYVNGNEPSGLPGSFVVGDNKI